MDELIVGARAVHFVALALLFGAPLFRLAIAPDGARTSRPGGRWIELAAGLAALASALAWFVGVTATMAGTWADAVAPDIVWTVAAETRFGHLWIARLIVMTAIILIHAAMVPSRGKDIALVILGGAAAGSLVGVGHGLAGAGALAPVHAVADMVHLLCAATWIGGLFWLAQILRRAVSGEGASDTLPVVLARFSRIGYGAVTLLLISGCINALILVPLPDRLVSTDYGRVLLVKISLAVLMVAIAVVNRVVLTKQLASSEPRATHALWRSVLVELAVGLLVLATVALLGTIHPVP